MVPARPVSPRRPAAALAAFLGAVLLSVTLAAPAGAVCRNVWQAYPNGDSDLVLVCDGEPVGGPYDSDSKPTPKPKPRQPTRAQYAALRYVPQAAVSARVRAEFAEAVAAGPNAEAARAEAESGVFVRDFQGVVRDNAWSTRDFADQYVLAYVMLWSIVHDRDSVSSPVVKAVRTDLRARLARDVDTRRASDAAKQAHIERLASWTVILVSDRNRAKAGGDTEGLARTQAGARDLARQPENLGVDLEDVTLSRKGAVGHAGGPRVQP